MIVGPIAAGKSTLAAEVGRLLRARGDAVAVVGLDEVADMTLRSVDWTWAHQVLGQLVRAWLATPVRTVVAEGPATPDELDLLVRSVPTDAGVLTVVLSAPYETALSRAAREPGRGLSRDPDFLRRAHDRFESGRAGLACDLALDSAQERPAALAQRVVVTLDRLGTTHAGTR